jgi:D-tyrosyl-tRNA(Tyr) deacylase
MLAVLTRVGEASVKIDGNTVAKIGQGFLLLLCAVTGDGEEECDMLADKAVGLRIFDDGEGRMGKSLEDIGGAMLIVSQFTLAADYRKGRRPAFINAAEPVLAKALYERFIARCRETVHDVQTGVFAADMQVSSVNDGPVTLILDTDKLKRSRRHGE